MSRLRQAAYGLALMAALGLLLRSHYHQLQSHHARAELASASLNTLEAANARQAHTIQTLSEQLRRQHIAQQQLSATREQQRQAHAQDQLHKQDAIAHDPSHQSWAAQPLPAHAQRLHQRPAFSGAADYRQWLLSRQRLHLERSRGEQQRPAQQ